ncbi:MAG TPA: hypothetical protein VLC46_05990 [Thermoanaerobaculia bacterium]|jgi:hypothetical protein|nr:hypothetical protein [Thermoanaerobaculia bacterium]
MEYIYVSFGEKRIVLVDGLASGNTNDTIGVQRGTHTITLGGVQNYTPPSQFVTVINTSYPNPMKIAFTAH